MRVAIVSQVLGTYSETFIQTHVDRLPYEILTLHGVALDQVSDGSLRKEALFERLWRYPIRKMGSFNDAKFLVQRQDRWFRKKGIEVVLAEYGPTGAMILPACLQAGVPLVTHFHGYDAHNRETLRENRERYSRLFAESAAVVGVSQSMVRQLVSVGAPRDRVHYIPYFVDQAQFGAIDPSRGGKSVLSVGRFVEKKAPHLTLLAFSEVLKSIPEARLEMAGEGPLLGPCRWLAKALGISEAVVFHGAKSHDWVQKAMQRARLFVQHSVEAGNGDSEGTPVAILEAQCCGLPVVATRHTGICDVVAEGKTGFLCEEGDYRAMSARMIDVLQMKDDELIAMSNSARQRIRTHFGKEQTLDRLAGLLRSVAKRPQ